MGLEEQIIQIIDESHKKSLGKCGIPIVNIQRIVNKEYLEIRPILNSLYKRKIIKVKEGLNSQLIFKNV